ncbi:response regulator transcription factor [Variovorax sp. Sphag1AA]|uniref:response regulator n=1 Tax=Variovorax sp. Sphag1AA TaxID=2587027 RepID=UPI00161E4B92|nr:response regulator transcription factor [Variovorax sp. Sphag1AA]MBB3178695.1 DNA-binding NarL/FixJ family response regulator [Variovorax sp. Sphag1AA]
MIRIYLVDDHAIVRDGLRAMLETRGHTVVGEAAEPTVALAELLRLQPELLVLDLSLGPRSGFELLTDIHRRALPVRSLVLTMSAQPRHVAEAMRLGAMGYLLKGSPRAELLRAVEAVAAGRRYLGPEVGELAAQALVSNNDEAALLDELSPRERQVVTLVVKGQSSSTIADQLHLSPKTVDTYRSRLMSKLGVDDVTALVRFAIRQGLIDAHGN